MMQSRPQSQTIEPRRVADVEYRELGVRFVSPVVGAVGIAPVVVFQRRRISGIPMGKQRVICTDGEGADTTKQATQRKALLKENFSSLMMVSMLVYPFGILN